MDLEREVHLVLILLNCFFSGVCFFQPARLHPRRFWAADMIMFLEMSSIDWPMQLRPSCNQLRLELLSNSCQFLVVLVLAFASVVGPFDDDLSCRCEGSTKQIVVGSGLWYTPSCNLDKPASPLHDSGRQSFQARRNSLRPMADDAVGAVAARYVSPTHCVHSSLSKLAPKPKN